MYLGVRKMPILGSGEQSFFQQVVALHQAAAVGGILHRISDLSSLFADRSATPSTPAVVDGVVGTIKNIAPSATVHAISPSDAARGILRFSGGKYHIEGDGVTTRYDYASNPLSAAAAAFCCAGRFLTNSPPTAIGALLSKFGDHGGAGEHEPYSDNTVYSAFASSARFTFGSISAYGTDDVVYEYDHSGTELVLRVNNTQIGTTKSATLQWRSTPLLFNSFEGGLYGLSIIGDSLSSADKTTVRNWIASESGVSL